jgi:hypothetical protein
MAISTQGWADRPGQHQVQVGDPMPDIGFNLTLARLVVHAGSDRDFGLIHHNDVVAQGFGAPAAYVNNVFCQGMWERTVREYVGLSGRIRRVGPMRLRRFNPAGVQVLTGGSVGDVSTDDSGARRLDLRLSSRQGDDVTIGPGLVVVTLPS